VAAGDLRLARVFSSSRKSVQAYLLDRLRILNELVGVILNGAGSTYL
jgi:hypothetical protein